MPDLLRDEETETRTHSLCLFGFPGITCTSNKRCPNCPGAARTPQYHQRRCPLDNSSEYNLFSPTQAGEGKSEIDPKLLASSSTTLQHDDEAMAKISSDISEISIRETSGRDARLDPGMRSRNTTRSVSVPHFEIGVKRKADQPESALREELADPQGDGSSCIAERMRNKHQKLVRDPQRTEALVLERLNYLSIVFEVSAVDTDNDDHSGRDRLRIPVPPVDVGTKLRNQRERSSRTEPASAFSVEASFTMEVNESAKSKGDQLDGRSDLKEYLQNKQEKIFVDLQPEEGPLFVPASMRSWLNDLSSDSNAIVDMREDHFQGEASLFGIRIPGIEMSIDKQGIRTCYDGIFSKNDPVEDELIAMDIEEPSIAQIGSYHSDDRRGIQMP